MCNKKQSCITAAYYNTMKRSLFNLNAFIRWEKILNKKLLFFKYLVTPTLLTHNKYNSLFAKRKALSPLDFT